MESTRFDALTRILAQGSSRRVTLRALTAATLAAGLTRLGLAGVAADRKCKKVGQKCGKNGDCCKGTHCKKGKCACDRGGQKCGTACCARGERCLKGENDSTCCPALKSCGKTCCPPDRVCVCIQPPPFDPPPDPDDLCRCICADGFEEDSDGNCVCPQPCGDDCCEEEDGEECCTVDGDKLCVLTSSSHNHCGGCGKACAKDRLCVGGKCVCPPGHLDCGDQCIPERFPNGGHGCCSDADCAAGGGFCCTEQHTFECDPNIPCGPPNHCMACL